MESNAQRVIKNTCYLYGRLAINMVLSLLTTRLILNSLGASDFGIFNIVAGAIAMLGFLNASMSAATQRFMSYAEGAKDGSRKKQIFTTSVLLHLYIAVVVVFILEIGFFVFFNGVLNIPVDRIPAAKFIYQCAILTTVLSIMSVPYEAILNAHENMLYYSIIGVLEAILKLLVALLVVYTSYDKLCLYGVLMTCIAFFIRLIMRIYCKHKYEECEFSVKHNYEKGFLYEMAGFAGWSSTSTISWLFCHQGLGLILNHFCGTILNAAHGITYQLSGQLQSLCTSASKALSPVIVKDAGAGDKEGMYKATLFGNKILFFLTAVCNLPVLINLSPLLVLWLKDVPPYTEIFITIYFCANLIDMLCQCQTTAIAGVGNIKNYQLSCAFVNIIPPILCIVLLNAGYPPYVLYITLVLAAVGKLFLRILYASKVCDFSMRDMLLNDLLRCILPFLITITLSMLYVQYKETQNIFEVLIASLASVCTYTVLFYYLGFNKQDRKYIVEIVKQVINKIRFFSHGKC